MNPIRDPAIDLLPRTINRATVLERDVVIIYPGTTPKYQALAEKLAKALVAVGAAQPECITDLELMPARSTPLPDSYRKRPLIVLGSLNTNRTLQPHYASFLCSTDATYPGGDGYDLRTLVNPYATGTNIILAGGSTLGGVERAVKQLLAVITNVAPTLALPFLLKVDIDPVLAKKLTSWPYTPLQDSTELQNLRSRGLMFFTEPIRVIGAYTQMWSWTADERYARIAVEALRRLNTHMTKGYGDWHYLAERFLRAIPLLIAGGMLTDEEIARTDELLLLTAFGNEDDWWRGKVGQPPLGHRHHGKGTFEFLLLARYIRDQTNPTPAMRAQCDRWISECYTFLDALSVACIDDQDDESTLNNLATLYRYALGQERHKFFTSGRARQVARRCIALHDNNGNGAGQGGYGESQGMYLQQEATEQTACSAFYYGDGELKWVQQKMPNLDIAQRYFGFRYAPVFLQKFDTGPELTAIAPPTEQGLTCLPITEHQLALTNHPPVHVEPQGHMVNKSETWQLPEGIGLNQLPPAQGFDKIVLRGGYDSSDAYLMIQGYQGGFRWQGHMQAANCIVRFYQARHVWLVQNTSRHSYHDKNGLLISDGANDTLIQPVAEQAALADFTSIALTVSRLTNYHHTDWTRHLFWSKPDDGYYVVIDRVAFQADGPYSLTCSWRTPGYAELHGRHWHSDQGQHRFTIVAGEEVAATCEIDTDQGGCSPYVLRQRRAGAHQSGDESSFQNLLTVRPLNSDETYDLQRLDGHTALVTRNELPLAWCAADLHPDFTWLPNAKVRAASVFIEAQSMVFAGVTELALAGLNLQSTAPISVSLDLETNAITLKSDTKVAVTLSHNGSLQNISLSSPSDAAGRKRIPSSRLRSPGLIPPSVTPLSPLFCTALSKVIGTWFGSLPTKDPESSATPQPDPTKEESVWQSAWSYDSGSRVPEIVRNIRITADPLPINGSPDEMLDPVMPDGYSREMWIQWPRSEHYTISLTLPQPRTLSALNILGDCIDDPTLRTYHPLPEGITVESDFEDGTTRACAVIPAPDRRYKRYRDAENRLAAYHARIDGKVSAVHVRLPAPADGSPFVLHRLEVLSNRTIAPAIEHWTTADLDGDGHQEIIFTNALSELIVLNDKGHEQWRHQLPVPITHISTQPVDPSGPPVLCVGMLGGVLHQYHHDGSLRRAWPIAQQFFQRKDCLQGWFNATHCINIWRRDENGRGCLVLGGYGILVFLNADGDIVGHSFVDGPWSFDILVASETRPDRGDLYVRCGWNHGIMYYPNVPGDGPSGEAFYLGGFNQPMFRMLTRVIPFLNGRSLAAEWVELSSLPDGALFFATELGCGVLSTATKEWHWKLEGGMSLNVASIGQVEGRAVALTGGVDGFVAAVDLSDGRVIRSQHVGAPVIGVAQTTNGNLRVATHNGARLLDLNWQSIGESSHRLNRVLPVGDDRLLVSHPDHTLEMLELKSVYSDSSVV